MSTHVDTGSRRNRDRPPLPAYGPIDAILGYVVFYVFVDRATPTVVDVFTAALGGVAPSLIRLGLAGALWFVLVVTLVDQVRRQLAALGIGSHEDADRAGRSRAVPTEFQTLGYLVVLLLGGVVAAWTFEPAIVAGISLIRMVGTLDVALFSPLEVATVVVFFVAFAGATRALDRLVVGGLRNLAVE